MISARDLREFRGFLHNATDRQVQGIYDKERRAGRDEYAELAVAEAERRGIYLERDDEGHARKKKSKTQLDREIAQALGDAKRCANCAGCGAVPVPKTELGRFGKATHLVCAHCGGGGSAAHATKLSAIPGIAKWDMSAGGTGAARGKHGYSHRAGIKGEYHIMPFTTKYGRHAGYVLKYAATSGAPRGGHSGLWHDLGTHRSPASAAKAAREHYARSFE